MKTLLKSAAAALALAVMVPQVSVAQLAMRGGWYDRQTVETVAGEVISVDKIASGARGYYGIHLMLKTQDGEIPVYLGPSWFLDRQTMKIAPRDLIEVTGSRVIDHGKPALIAAQIKRGKEQLRLRSAEGLPLWRGFRAR
jgi:hypothetical protein